MISIEKIQTPTSGERKISVDDQCSYNDETLADHVNSNLERDQAEQSHLIESPIRSPYAVTITPLDVDMLSSTNDNSGSLCNQNPTVSSVKLENALEELETASQEGETGDIVSNKWQPKQDDEVMSRRDSQINNTINSDDDQVSNALTSLFAHVDKVKREVDQLITEQPADNKLFGFAKGEFLSSSRWATNEGEANGLATNKRRFAVVALNEKQVSNANDWKLYRHMSEADTLIAIQHLVQRRHELKSIDQQIANIMTEYLIQLDVSRKNSGQHSEIDMHNHYSHDRNEQTSLNNDLNPLIKCDQNFNNIKTNDAIDLSLISNKSVYRTNSYSAPFSEVTTTNSCHERESEKVEVKKRPSINLKKSRLLAANFHTNESKLSSANHSREPNQFDGHQADLNLLKRYSTQPQELASLTISSATNKQFGLDNYNQRLIWDSYKAQQEQSFGFINLLESRFSAANSAASAANSKINSINNIEPDSASRPHFKKFRSLSYQPTSSYEQQCNEQTARHNSVSDSALLGIRNHNMDHNIVAFAQKQHQKQQLMSEFLQSAATSPEVTINSVRRGSSPRSDDYRHFGQDNGDRQEGKCCNGPLIFSSDRSTAYILATMQHTNNGNKSLFSQQDSSEALHLQTPTAVEAQHKMAYRCHVCGSGFEDRHRLQQHLSIHLNLHPSWFEEKTIKETMAQYESKRGDYLCTNCNVRFETTAEFDKHMHLHGDKPHRCELCNQDNKLVSFRYYRQLLTHLRSHCFLYSCRFAPECKQTSNRKDYLKLHILKHHLNNKLPEQYTICCH